MGKLLSSFLVKYASHNVFVTPYLEHPINRIIELLIRRHCDLPRSFVGYSDQSLSEIFGFFRRWICIVLVLKLVELTNIRRF